MAISVGSGRCGRQSLPSLNGYYGKNCHSCQTVGVHRLQCTECERTETFLIRMVGSHLEVRTKNQMLEDFYSEHVLNFLCIIFERRDKKYYSEITTFWFLYSLQQLNTCAEMTTVFSCVCVRARARVCVLAAELCGSRYEVCGWSTCPYERNGWSRVTILTKLQFGHTYQHVLLLIPIAAVHTHVYYL